MSSSAPKSDTSAKAVDKNETPSSLNKSTERKNSALDESKKAQRKSSKDDKRSLPGPKETKKAEEQEQRSMTSSRRRATSTAKTMMRTLQLPDGGVELPSFEGKIDPDEPLPATNNVSWLLQRPVMLRTASTGPLAQKPVTVMSVLRETVSKYPNKMAYASMVDGKWVKVTYQKLLDQVHHAAQSFIKLGLQRFNGVGILGHNATEYVVAHFGIIFAGGVSVPLHINSPDEFTLSLVKAAQCRIVVVDSVKLRPQVLEWQKTLPNLKTIVQFGHEKSDGAADPFAVGTDNQFKSDILQVYTWHQFMKIGNDLAPDVLVTRTLQQAPNLCCCVMQTAGSSGYPKNVMLSHDNINWGAKTCGRYYSASDGNGVTVTFLPLSGILGMTVCINFAVLFGTSVYMIPATKNKALIIRVVKEVRPTILFGPYVFFDSLRREIESQFRRKSFFTRIIIRWAMKVGRSAFDDYTRRTNPPGCWMMANRLLFRKLRKQIGLDACIELISAGGFITRPALEFFLSIDMPVLLAYGLTESTGPHTFGTVERFRIESVGVGIDGCDARIEHPDSTGVGELCIAGRNVAMGYLGNEELTKQFFAEDGTFRTGDLARKDSEGFIYIVGKISDIVTLSSGEKISTAPIVRTVLSNLSFVSHALIVGEGRAYLLLLRSGASPTSAMEDSFRIAIKGLVSEETLAAETEMDLKTEQPSDQLSESAVQWFRKAGFDVRLVRDIIPKSDPKLMEKIQTIIDRINLECPHVAHQIKRWTLLANDFTTQSDELSPTLKLRRWMIVERYAATIDSMYP